MNQLESENHASNNNFVLKSVLPVDELIEAGRHLEDLPTIESYARSLAKAIRTDPYDPGKNPDDRLREEQFHKDVKELEDAEKAAAHSAISLLDAQRQQAVTQSALVEPRLPLKIIGTAVAALTTSIAPTLHDQFFSSFDDKLLGWSIAFATSLPIALFLTWSIVGVIDPSGKRSTTNWAGLIGAIGVGICCFLLRISSGDLYSATALTLLECSAVVILECLATGLRERYHQFNLACEAQMKTSAEVQARKSESERRNQALQEIRSRVEAHKQYVVIRTFCSQKPKEIEEAALDYARKSYRERQAEEARIRRGIPKELRS